jgi:hypothetical protein
MVLPWFLKLPRPRVGTSPCSISWCSMLSAPGRAAYLAALAILACPSTGSAHGDWPDGPHKRWFESLQRPDNHKNPQRDRLSLSCCGAGDVVKTRFRVLRDDDVRYPEDRWYAWLNDTWVLIPPDKVVPDHAPDGQAYLFVWAVRWGEFDPLSDDIVCFVRPKGGL